MVEFALVRDLVPCTMFEICQTAAGGKSGALVCTLTGIEFQSSKKNLIILWNEISCVKLELSRGAGTATLNVERIGARPMWFQGRSITEDGYMTLEKIGAALGPEQNEKRKTNSTVQTQTVQTQVADVVDGTGWAPPVGTKVAVAVSEESITLSESQSTEYVLPLSALRNIAVEGHTSKTNFGLMGFGFGIKGAAESIAIARIVNRLTTKVKTWVLVSIDSPLGRATLLILNTNEAPIRHFFRAAQDKALELASKPQIGAKDDLVSALERITMLYENGLLSGDEFKKMKKKLLP